MQLLYLLSLDHVPLTHAPLATTGFRCVQVSSAGILFYQTIPMVLSVVLARTRCRTAPKILGSVLIALRLVHWRRVCGSIECQFLQVVDKKPLTTTLIMILAHHLYHPFKLRCQRTVTGPSLVASLPHVLSAHSSPARASCRPSSRCQAA